MDLVDPLFGVLLTDSLGYPLSYIEAEQRWDEIKYNFPLSYQATYRYQDIRYTNWDKYGWASRLAKSILTPIMEKKN